MSGKKKWERTDTGKPPITSGQKKRKESLMASFIYLKKKIKIKKPTSFDVNIPTSRNTLSSFLTPSH